jgi:hypothetical protein
MPKEQDVFQLPFKITEINEDMLVALHRNFKEIEHHLSFLQTQIKYISNGGVSDLKTKGEIWDRSENITKQGTFLTEKLEGLIEELQIADEAVTRAKIKDLAINSAKIADNSIIMEKLAEASVSAEKLADFAVEMSKLANGAVSEEKVAKDAITADKIAANAVGANAIAANAIVSEKINAGAITTDKIFADAITADKIKSGAITSEKIQAGAVTADKMQVNELSAITSNIGHITAGLIDAGVISIGAETTFAEGYDPVDNHLYFQYSVDGVSNWHDTFNPATDKYMRQKVGDNGTWSEPMRVVGEDGQDIRVFTSQPVPPYDIGDLWIKNEGSTFVCITSKTSGSYSASNWRDVSQNKFDTPGYVLATPEGIKVFDDNNALRVSLGSWIRDSIRRYGLKIIEGEIYASFISTRNPEDTSFNKARADINPNGTITIFDMQGQKGLELSGLSGQGAVDWYYSGTKYAGSFINAGTNKDLVIWTVRNESGIILRPWNDRTGIDIGSDGENGVNLKGDYVSLNTPYAYVSGDMWVSGSLYKGTNHYVEPTKNYGIRLLNAVESPEMTYLDRGRARLENGECVVYLDPIFLETIEPDTDLTPWTFQVEVYGEGEDIRVLEWGETYFKVKECNGGKSNRMFGWWFYATRINHAGIRLMELVKGVN